MKSYPDPRYVSPPVAKQLGGTSCSYAVILTPDGKRRGIAIATPIKPGD